MSMESQVIPLEDGAYTVQFFDDAGNTISIYFHDPRPGVLSSDEAVTEALNRLGHLIGQSTPTPAAPLS